MTAAEGYEVDWTPGAVRALSRLPEKVATVVVELVYGALADNPHHGGRAQRFELERPHYRVVYQIDDALVVTIIEAHEDLERDVTAE